MRPAAEQQATSTRHQGQALRRGATAERGQASRPLRGWPKHGQHRPRRKCRKLGARSAGVKKEAKNACWSSDVQEREKETFS